MVYELSTLAEVLSMDVADKPRMVRVTGVLTEFFPSGFSTLQGSNNEQIAVDMRLADVDMGRIGSLVQCLGDVCSTGGEKILPDGKTCEEGVYLRAKIIRCVEGLDQVLYDQAMDLVRSRHVVDPGR